ncbi:hypothetical protein [Persicitalea jodogahamensis]|uniref:Uncharacterized protein n=1 Tax=Persicitalea jodogahamensis TaxID=402147 RepID=A0A8J3G9C1_9BACT|nr:hypothetical protein [Persicitalea jodogahamensis]GHB73415.1 hypothetical protein GCM10007390_29440 [Persicitalea jodogahamensis]
MKIINSRVHGIIDYLVVVFLLAAPLLFGLPYTTTLFTYALGGIHLALTLLTNTEMGLIKMIPFPIHGWIELIVALALVGAAFYLGSLDGDLARNFYLGFAGAVFLTWALTDYRASQGSFKS